MRLCRRRFWKGEYEQDKISAYQTLYSCLETVAKLAAPIAPFFMDQLFKDLIAVTGRDTVESVHLADFPKYDSAYINPSLERKMQKAQAVSSLVLSIRQKEKIKVRQPLQRIMIPIMDQTEKEDIRSCFRFNTFRSKCKRDRAIRRCIWNFGKTNKTKL